MPFGKYRGERLEDVPFAYLEWLTALDLREPLRTHVEEEFERRAYTQESKSIIDPNIVDELVGAGLRVLSKKYHPDMGSDHDCMVAVNQVADWLRQQARALS